MARKHFPTAASRRQVTDLSIAGTPAGSIAAIMGIGRATLWRKYKDELQTARPVAIAKVARSLFDNATKHNNVAAQIFYLKTQAGWKEPKQEIQHSGAVGSYDLSKVSLDDLKRLEEILAPAALGNPGGDQEEGGGDPPPEAPG
jgi:hypothetical protein